MENPGENPMDNPDEKKACLNDDDKNIVLDETVRAAGLVAESCYKDK